MTTTGTAPDLLDNLPFRRVLSLHKLVARWRALADTAQDPAVRGLAEQLASRAESIPEMINGVESAEQLAPHNHLIEQLMAVVVPLTHSEDWLAAGMTPFRMEVFFGTPRFMEMLAIAEVTADDETCSDYTTKEERQRAEILEAYHVILNTYYNVDLGLRFPTVFRIALENNLNVYYRVHVDPQFVDIDVVGDLPELTPDDISRLAANPMDLDLWYSLLPAENFVFRGFTTITLIDVSEHETNSRLKNDLLERDALMSPVKLDRIEGHLRDLMGIPDLRIGVIGLETGRFEDIDESRTLGRSLLRHDNCVPECAMRDQSSYAELFSRGEAIVISDLDSCTFCTGFEHHIREQGLRGLLLAPLKDSGRIVGVLELATSEPDRLTAFSVIQLTNVVSLFAAAMMRSLDEHHDRIQALIKEEFTSIHPSVEWRFRRAAERLERSIQEGEKREPEDIVFEDVYPLYGLSDIRDSSIQRNRAIQADLIEQLGLALSVIVEASSYQPLPALDELGFRIARFVQTIEAGLSSDAEVGALGFLRNDVEPLFERLAGSRESIRSKVEEYRSAVDNTLGVLYKRRRNYEESVALVNKTVSDFLQKRQSEAQAMFPHYFEKFETDGVDYNIYVGAEIAEDETFDILYLRNLRLWQLQTMCGVVWQLAASKGKLPVPLEVAHLVLVQDFPIAIRFSKDEKRFGVDGAYNARYMIVKKRIDKARVLGSSERITQPGKIAVVYSQQKERREYMRYLDYLIAAGYVEDNIEDLEVEPLQGVTGLRALRVTVSEQKPEMEVRTHPDLDSLVARDTEEVA